MKRLLSSIDLGELFNRDVGTDSSLLYFTLQNTVSRFLPTVAIAFIHAILAVISLKPLYPPWLKEFSARTAFDLVNCFGIEQF